MSPSVLRALSLFLLSTLSGSGVALGHGAFELANGRWLVDGRFVERTMYSVEGVLAERFDGEVDSVIDLGAGWVVPPLADAHTHALASPDFATESRRFLAAGVFYAKNPHGLRSWTDAARPEAERPETVDVVYAEAGVTSPGGHPTQIYDGLAGQVEGLDHESLDGEAYFTLSGPEALEARWEEIAAGEPDFLKLYLERSELHAERAVGDEFVGRRGLEPELYATVVERAHRAGLAVSTHVTSAADFRIAVAAGSDEIAHLPLERLSEREARAAAAAGTVVVTTVTSHRPAVDAAGRPIEDLEAVHAHNLALLDRSGVRLVLGTDSAAGVLAEARRVAELTGWSAGRLVDLATRVTPRWIFPERAVGILETGAEATFLVLDRDPTRDLTAFESIRYRVKRGHSLEMDEPAPRRQVAQSLAHVLMRDGAEAALAEYRRLRAEEPEGWDFSEPQLNAVGYFALQHGRPDDAVAVFRYNAELFAASSNVWDSLGDGLAALGDVAGAAKAYRKAIEIDPANEGSREKLEKLEQ